MRKFTIRTSRGITTNIETDDPALSMDHALDVASMLHRPVKWEDTFADGLATGTYLHNGVTEFIAVTESDEDGGVQIPRFQAAMNWISQSR
jgi:hypothetical protein